MAPTPILTTKHLSKHYRLGKISVSALKNATFAVSAGAFVCITGKSGSGKSTLLRQLGLIDIPDSGTVTIEGTEVTHLTERKRSRLRLEKLGYVFQEYALIPELTAAENVALPGLMHGTYKKADVLRRAHILLSEVGMKERSNHRPNELSGGQQQRVAIARALINEPAILYADEPTANLDTASAKNVMDILQRLNKERGLTVFLVSHDPEDKKYADTTITMQDGTVTAIETR